MSGPDNNAGTGGTPGADGAAGTGGTPGADGAAGAGGDAAAASGRPEWLPPEFWDEPGARILPSAQKFVDTEGKAVRVGALLKSREDAEAELQRLRSASAPPSEYKIAPPDGVPVPELADPEHPLSKLIIEAAKKTGTPAASFDAMTGAFFEGWKQSKDYEMARLAAETKGGPEGLKTRLEALGGRIKAVAETEGAAAGEKAEGVARQVADTLRLMASTAVGVRLLERMLSGEIAKGIATYTPMAGGGAPAGGVTLEQLRKLQETKEYQQGDSEMQKRVSDGYKALYGGA